MPSPINRRGLGTIFKNCAHADWDRCRDPWTVRYYDADKRQKERTGFSTKTDAWDRLTAIREEKRQAKGTGKIVPTEDLTFSEFAEGRIARRRRLAEKTKGQYRMYLRLHINPNIGFRRLSMFRDEDLFSLVERLESSGMHPAYIDTLITRIVVPTLQAANKQGRTPLMRFEDLKDLVPEYTAKRRYCPSQAEIEAVANEIDPRLKFAVYLMAGCGLRLGEALGVDEDCFIADGVLRVTRQWRADSKFGPLKHKKDGDYRDVPFPRYLEEVRQEHIAAGFVKDGHYFPAFRGSNTLVSHRNSHKCIGDAVRRAGVNLEITAHNFRHAFATYAISGGAQIPEVAMWLGHSNINITYRVYGHLVKPSFDRARTILDNFFRAA
jgi:integrase